MAKPVGPLQDRGFVRLPCKAGCSTGDCVPIFRRGARHAFASRQQLYVNASRGIALSDLTAELLGSPGASR